MVGQAPPRIGNRSGHVMNFEAKVECFDGQGGWHGVFLPEDAAAEVRFFGRANALGMIAVQVEICTATTRTSLFPDKRRRSFLLPLKAELRGKAGIVAGDRIAVTLLLLG